MNSKTRAIIITAGAAGLPFFLTNVWAPIVWRLPFSDLFAWVVSVGPAMAAALRLQPKEARTGLVVQAVASLVLLKYVAWEITWRFGLHPHMAAPVMLAVGAALAWKIIPATSDGPGASEAAAAPRPSAAPAPRASSQVDAGTAPAPRRSKAKLVLKVLGVLLVLGAFAGACTFIYLELTKLDRTVKEAESSTYVSRETWQYLGDRGDDPRVHALFTKLLLLRGESGYLGTDELDGMKAAFAKKKPEDSKALVPAVLSVVLLERREEARAWLPCDWEDRRVTDALVDRVLRLPKESSPSVYPPFVVELERRKVPGADELVVAVGCLYLKTDGQCGKKWLEENTRSDEQRKALRREALKAYQESYVWKPEAWQQKRMDFLASELVARCQGASSDEVLDGLMTIYQLNGAPKQCDAAVRGLAPEAAARYRARSEREPNFHEKHVALVLACLAGGGRETDIPELIAQTLRHPVLDDDYYKKLESAGFPPPLETGPADVWYHETARRALVAIGKPAIAQLTSGLSVKCRDTVHVCAGALAEVAPDALVAEVEKKIDAYNRSAPLLAIARDVIIAREPDLERARKIVRDVHPLLEAVAEGLLAAEKIGDPGKADEASDRANLCFMHGLSSTDESVAKHCANVLKKRMDRDRFVHVLFKFLVHKESFDVREVAVYETALKEFGVAASSAITRNLDKLLDEAGGEPGKVFWIHKVIALRCLAEVGDEKAVSTIEKYARDPGSYVHIESRTDPKTKKVLDRKETTVPFKDLCERALAAIARRG